MTKIREELSEVEVAYTNMASNLKMHAVSSPTVLIPTVTQYLDLRKAAQNERKRRTVPMQAP